MKKLLLSLFIFGFSLSTLKAQSKWSPRASLPDSNRCGAVGFSIGNYGYVGLGCDTYPFPHKYFNDFWQFNPSNNSWTRKANFPGRARVSPVIFVIGNYAYVVTGGETIYAQDFVAECWQYNSLNDKWIQKHNFPGLSRLSGVGFAIGGKGYLGTGYDTLGIPNPVLRDFWEYDTGSDTWTQKHNFGGVPRYAASAFAVGGKGYICFGLDSAHTFYRVAKDMWSYDPGTDSWIQKSNNPVDTLGFTSGFVIGNNIYVGTGQSPKFHDAFWAYNTNTDTWTQQASFMGGKRALCASFSVGDTGYLGFGWDSIDITFNSLYRFLSDSTTGIEKLFDSDNKILAYPNPFRESCYISLPQNINISSVSFFLNDIQGREEQLDITRLQGNNYVIRVSNLQNGIYILSVSFNNQTIHKKLIIAN